MVCSLKTALNFLTCGDFYAFRIVSQSSLVQLRFAEGLFTDKVKHERQCAGKNVGRVLWNSRLSLNLDWRKVRIPSVLLGS